jgi:hypothetical protein
VFTAKALKANKAKKRFYVLRNVYYLKSLKKAKKALRRNEAINSLIEIILMPNKVGILLLSVQHLNYILWN